MLKKQDYTTIRETMCAQSGDCTHCPLSKFSDCDIRSIDKAFDLLAVMEDWDFTHPIVKGICRDCEHHLVTNGLCAKFNTATHDSFFCKSWEVKESNLKV